MNVLKPQKKATVITLLANGVSRNEISRKAGIDIKTVRKYATLHLGAAVADQKESKSHPPATGSCPLCLPGEWPMDRKPGAAWQKCHGHIPGFG